MAKELPILFTADMVRVKRAGRKTVTRRVIVPQPEYVEHIDEGSHYEWKDYQVDFDSDLVEFARYQPGDLLWTKESYCHGIEWDDCKPSEVDPLCGGSDIWYLADGPRPTEGWGKTRSGLFMPKWVARTRLEVVSVRAERLQDITEEDAIREGALFTTDPSGKVDWSEGFAIACFCKLWDSINLKRGYPWESNPWVWRIEFKEATNG